MTITAAGIAVKEIGQRGDQSRGRPPAEYPTRPAIHQRRRRTGHAADAREDAILSELLVARHVVAWEHALEEGSEDAVERRMRGMNVEVPVDRRPKTTYARPRV